MPNYNPPQTWKLKPHQKASWRDVARIVLIDSPNIHFLYRTDCLDKYGHVILVNKDSTDTWTRDHRTYQAAKKTAEAKAKRFYAITGKTIEIEYLATNDDIDENEIFDTEF